MQSLLALDGVAGLDSLIKQILFHAGCEAPFREDLRCLRELFAFPILANDVGIEVVFGAAASGIQEIPEVTR